VLKLATKALVVIVNITPSRTTIITNRKHDHMVAINCATADHVDIIIIIIIILFFFFVTVTITIATPSSSIHWTSSDGGQASVLAGVQDQCNCAYHTPQRLLHSCHHSHQHRHQNSLQEVRLTWHKAPVSPDIQDHLTL
jgi:hypothetical protein